MSLFDWLLNPAGLTPHGFCLSWAPGLVILHAASDAIIGLSYFSIPLALYSFARRRLDFQYHSVLLAFAGFIVACGATHLLAILTLWVPVYGIEGVVKALTAILSVGTAIILWPLLPRLLALPSPSQLASANSTLTKTLAELEQVNVLLEESVANARNVNDELELRVEERTHSLLQANARLQTAIETQNAVTKNLETEILKREQADNRFRHIFEAVPTSLIMVGDDGFIELINSATETMFGYDRNELLGKAIDILVPAHLRATHIRHRSSYCETPTSRSMGEGTYLSGVRKDGSEISLEIALSPVAGFDHRNIVASIVDVSKRRQMERALSEARDASDAANRAKSSFLAAMSHEIRTPMNGVMGMNALLLNTELTPRQRQMAQTVHESAESLLTIIDNILDISKLEANKFDLENIDFGLIVLVDNVVALLKPRADQKSLILKADMKSISRTEFCGDPTRLRQILLNFVSNAIKFTEDGEITIMLQNTDVDEGHSVLRCEVHDTGRGVSEEAKRRLFRPFEQENNSITRRFGGTGLGLSICRKLIEAMQGRIGVTDRLGGGSVFWFEIAIQHAIASPVGAQEHGNHNASTARHTGRILLAEDNLTNIEFARIVLENAGFTVDVALNGVEAIKAFSSCDYDLILMDVQMPELDGLSASRKIRAVERGAKRIPIIAMTANAMREDRRQCLDAGMDDYISKPFKPFELVKSVAERIGLSVPPKPPNLRYAKAS